MTVLISDMISALQKAMNEHGDIPLAVERFYNKSDEYEEAITFSCDVVESTHHDNPGKKCIKLDCT